MKKFVVILSILISMVSCETEDGPPFYRFSNSDYDFIPTVYKDLDTIRFKNQQNDEVRFEVFDYRMIQKHNGSRNWFSGEPMDDFYYTDKISINLSLLDIDSTKDTCFSDVLITFEKMSNGTTKATFRLPIYRTHCTHKIFELISPYRDLNEMTIGNEIFYKVKVFEPEDYCFFIDDSTYNKLYFDFKKGIIGFDDSKNGFQYRMVN